MRQVGVDQGADTSKWQVTPSGDVGRPVDESITSLECRSHGRALQVAVAPHRSHQPVEPRHRQARRRRHRRPDDQRGSQDARGGASASASASPSAIEMIAVGAAQGRPHRLRRRRHERPPRHSRIGGDAADLQHRSRPRAGDHGRRPRRDLRRQGRRRGQLRGRRALDHAPAPDARRTSSSACRPAA